MRNVSASGGRTLFLLDLLITTPNRTRSLVKTSLYLSLSPPPSWHLCVVGRLVKDRKGKTNFYWNTQRPAGASAERRREHLSLAFHVGSVAWRDSANNLARMQLPACSLFLWVFLFFFSCVSHPTISIVSLAAVFVSSSYTPFSACMRDESKTNRLLYLGQESRESWR